MSRLPFLLAFAALAAVAPAAVSTFDHDDEGWTTCNFDFGGSVASGFDRPTYSSEGYVSTGDVDFWCFLAAPSKFLGDQSGAFGTSLTYDTSVDLNDGMAYPSAILQGGGRTLFSVGNAPGPSWTPTAIPLFGSAWSESFLPGGAPVGDAELRGVLGGLTGLFIEADWVNDQSTSETTRLDNVRLQTVPEPGSLAALAFGAMALRRRRAYTRMSSRWPLPSV